MSIADAATPLHVYERCSSYAQLLNADRSNPVVVRLRASIRQWKKRKQLLTPEEAFQSYRHHLFTLDGHQDAPASVSAPSTPSAPSATLPSTSTTQLPQPFTIPEPLPFSSTSSTSDHLSCTALPSQFEQRLQRVEQQFASQAASLRDDKRDRCVICTTADCDTRLLPCRHDSFCGQCAAKLFSVGGATEKTHRDRKRKRRHAHGKTSLMLPCPVCQQPVLSCESNANSTDRDRVTQLVKLVNTMRRMKDSPAKPLRTSCIDARYHYRLRVLSIVGDGRCQLYSLLQSEQSMIPTTIEADELRSQLQLSLTTLYDDAEWEQRVPAYTREIIGRDEFGQRYLTEPTAHLPFDSIAVWQDMRQNGCDVYLVHQTEGCGEYIDKIPCEGGGCCIPAKHAVVLLFTHDGGVGHYELITYSNVVRLPVKHEFIQHLQALHDCHLAELRGRTQVRREAVRAAKLSGQLQLARDVIVVS